MQQYRNSHLVVARGAIAQLGERLHGMQEVGGSIPPGSTITPARSARLPPTFLGRRAAAVAMRRVAWLCVLQAKRRHTDPVRLGAGNPMVIPLSCNGRAGARSSFPAPSYGLVGRSGCRAPASGMPDTRRIKARPDSLS